MPELTTAQRFRLGVLCEEYADALSRAAAEVGGAVGTCSGLMQGLAPLVRFLFDEGIHWRGFTARDRLLYPYAF